MQQERRSGNGRQRGNTWSGPENKSQEKKLGVKEKARRKKCKVRFSILEKHKAFQQRCMKVGVENVATCGNDASKDMESACSRCVAPTERSKWRRQTAAVAGNSSTTSSLSLFMEAYGSIWPRSRRGTLHLGHSVLG